MFLIDLRNRTGPYVDRRQLSGMHRANDSRLMVPRSKRIGTYLIEILTARLQYLSDGLSHMPSRTLDDDLKGDYLDPATGMPWVA